MRRVFDAEWWRDVRFRRFVALCLTLGLLLIHAGRLLAQPDGEQTKAPAAAAEPIQPQVFDIKMEAGEKIGSQVIRFSVVAPKGTKFFIWWMNEGMRGAHSTGPAWKMESDDPAQVEIIIDYNLAFAGDRGVNVFNSRERTLAFRFTAQGGVREGLSGIASAPIYTVPPEERAIELLPDAHSKLAFTAKHERRVLIARPKSEIGKNAEAMTPRTELVVGAYVESPPKKPDEAQSLRGAFYRQLSEVGSAHIKFRRHRQGPGDYLPLKRDEVQRIVEEAKLDEHPENFVSILKKLLVPESRGQISAGYDFWSMGLKTAERGDFSSRTYDGEFDFNRRGNEIDAVRGMHRGLGKTTLHTFRMTMPIADFSLFVQEPRPPNDLLLTNDLNGQHFEVLADWKTGFIRRTTFLGKNSASDDLQFAPQTYPGGIVFPTLKMEFSYRDDELNRVEALYIDEAQFNENLPPDIFKVAAHPGTRVHVYPENRSATDRGQFFPIKEETADLAAYLRDKLPPEERQP